MNELNLTVQLRRRQSLRSNKNLYHHARILHLAQYKAYHIDCVKIDVEALPAGVEFHPKDECELLLVADDRGAVSIIDTEADGKIRQIVRHQWVLISSFLKKNLFLVGSVLAIR